MKYAFWNTHKREDINIYLQSFIEIYEPDVFALAEYEADGKCLENNLREKGLGYTFISKIGSRLDMFYKGSKKHVIHCNDSKYYTIKIVPYGKKKLILSITHMPSKRYSDEATNEEILREMLNNINKIRNSKHINNLVIVGDFNMNPFEAPMINATALQAISSKDIVTRRNQRIYKEKNREFLYNPMWNFLGDMKHPIGSYYYGSPQNAAFYWNTFDQFVVNSELADEINVDKIEFVRCIGALKLENENGEPTVSDHFPLYFEIGEE